MFKCEYCGKEYSSPAERANCEIKCNKVIQEKVEKDRLKKLNAEKSERLTKIREEITKYNKDYKAYYFLGEKSPIADLFWFFCVSL